MLSCYYFMSYKPLKKRLKQLLAPDFFTTVGICAASPPHDGSSSSVVGETLQESHTKTFADYLVSVVQFTLRILSK